MNASCNWVDLLQVSSFQFMCCRRSCNGFSVVFNLTEPRSVACSGQRPTDGSALDAAAGRPTSYQPALVACYRPPPPPVGGGARREEGRLRVQAAERHRATQDDRSAGSTVHRAGVWLTVVATIVFVYLPMRH